MEITWLSLIPPLIVFFTVFLMKNVILALALGIISGTLVVTNFSLLDSIYLLNRYSFNQITDLDTLYVFCFLTTLGALTALINYTGGTVAYGQIIKRSLSNARSAQYASLSLSLLLCFDDFFSSITTGCIMRPITDHFKIPRAKLAFLIDAMAAPVAILVPFSSWIAMLMMQLNKAGVRETVTATTTVIADPFLIYIQIIPFIFYSVLIICSTFFIVYREIAFGSMHQHELIAQTTGNLFGGKEDPHTANQNCAPQQGTFADFIIPIALLLISIIGTLLYYGDAWILGGKNSIFTAFMNTSIFFSLALGSSIAFALSMIYFAFKQKLNWQVIPTLLYEGIQPMGYVMLILLCAWIFSSLMVNDLKSGQFLASLLVNKISIWLLPALCFVLATVTSISVGSSWGTIAILTPLAVPTLLGFTHLTLPITPDQLPLIFPLFGAIFAGAVAGDQISPLSSTTIMASTSSGSYHFDHVRTQVEYAIPALIGSFLGYVLCGFFMGIYGLWISLIISLPCAIVSSLLLLFILNSKKSS